MRIVKSPLLVLVVASLFSSLSFGVTPDRVKGALANGQTVKLTGNVHRKALPEFDQGPVDPALRLGTITLLTVPTASQQTSLRQVVAQQQDSTSANFHKWLTPEQYADDFGLSRSDVQKIAAWLKSQGFSTIQVARARNWVSFNGTAAQVDSAFGTEIHRYSVKGELHYANSVSPSIPAALASVVTAVRGLNDFRPKPLGIRRNIGLRPDYNSTNLGDVVAPGDIKMIYDVKPLYDAGIDGTGQKLAVAGQTDVYLADLTDFRTGFGLSAISCTTNGSGVITACNDPHFKYVLGGNDPGVSQNGDVSEADLDLEWSGATARNAQVIYVNSTDTFTSYYYAIDHNLAPVVSLSYGLCELDNAGFFNSDEAELALGNSEGITIVNSSGDSGAAQCDYSNTPAVRGLSVSYPASSPSVTGVGGTSVPLNEYTGTYWGTTNGSDGGTALGYIPEVAWNDDELIGQFCSANLNNTFCKQGGSTAVQGWVPITSTATAQADIGISSTGGGPSNCKTSSAGVCTAGFPKPSFQTVTISGQASARFTPDVSLLASPNFPGFIFCTQLSELGLAGTGSTCASGISNAVENDFSVIGGTSASAPVFAGMVTLLNQYLAGPSSPGLGNINPTLYSLAQTPSNQAFHPVTSADNIAYCTSGTPSSQPVALRCPSGSSFGYNASNADATTGYNLVTGLGSVDLNKLAIAWAATRTASTISISPSASQINQGDSVTFTATVSSSTALGTVSFFNNGSTTSLGTASLTSSSNGVATFPTTALPGGTNHVTATYNGDGLIKPSTTATAATVMVIAPDFSSPGLSATSGTVVAGHTANAVTVTITPINGYNQVTTLSCAAPPTGVACSFNPATVTPDGTHAITTSMTVATAASMATGATALTVSATNGASLTHTSAFTLTVNTTDQSFTIAPQNSTYGVPQGQSANVTLTLTPTNGFNTAVTYTCVDPAPESHCTGPNGATASTSPAFVITTTAAVTDLRSPFSRGIRIFYATLLPGLLGIMFTAGARKRSLGGMRLLGLIVVLGFSTLWLSSCGGGGGGNNNKDPGTPKGPYTVVVNATTGGANPLTATTNINLLVQ
jgi:subtilase family serine protease